MRDALEELMRLAAEDSYRGQPIDPMKGVDVDVTSEREFFVLRSFLKNAGNFMVSLLTLPRLHKRKKDSCPL